MIHAEDSRALDGDLSESEDYSANVLEWVGHMILLLSRNYRTGVFGEICGVCRSSCTHSQNVEDKVVHYR